jgi:hypothetical protein
MLWTYLALAAGVLVLVNVLIVVVLMVASRMREAGRDYEQDL